MQDPEESQDYTAEGIPIGSANRSGNSENFLRTCRQAYQAVCIRLIDGNGKPRCCVREPLHASRARACFLGRNINITLGDWCLP